MRSGLLWYDGDAKTPLASKIERAVARYQARFGQRPNACYVNPASLERETECHGVRVVGAPNILPGHFWVGIESAWKDHPATPGVTRM